VRESNFIKELCGDPEYRHIAYQDVIAGRKREKSDEEAEIERLKKTNYSPEDFRYSSNINLFISVNPIGALYLPEQVQKIMSYPSYVMLAMESPDLLIIEKCKHQKGEARLISGKGSIMPNQALKRQMKHWKVGRHSLYEENPNWVSFERSES